MRTGNIGLRIPVLLAFLALINFSEAQPLRFEVNLGNGLTLPRDLNGRVFVIISKTNEPEPRLLLGKTGPGSPQALARDVSRLKLGQPVILDSASFAYPITNLGAIAPGDYFVQALLDFNRDLRSPNAPMNVHSEVVQKHLDPAQKETLKLELTEQLPADRPPAETDQIKFVRFESKLLSKFHQRPIFLRAGILLPRDYDKNPDTRYPLWVRIGGLNTRYTTVTRLLRPGSEFAKTWMADETPRFILLQLDGAGPWGDPYYINSANNGPYADALTTELIPFIESKFRGNSRRVLSGTSTGGWVSLALQIFHPDFFQGAWSSSPDPVDFRAFQLLNIYKDKNAFVTGEGTERPSARNLQGAVTLTMREEVSAENLLGKENCYTASGEQWGEWNAAFGPVGSNGLPAPLWDPSSGKMDPRLLDHWKKYDLRLYLEQNWVTLAPRLRGRLHIAAGEADQYYLNNAVHLLDEFLAHAKPSIDAKIVFGPGKGHGWFDLTLSQMLNEMNAATQKAGG